jgi:virulence-associated protein VapD
MLAELQRRGIEPDSIGTHSMRKGSATYCSSGSTSCPSSTSIHLRAGWSLGGVQNTYLRYESAGDMFVGRTAAGLPSETEQFGVLPPHFENSCQAVQSGIRTCFPGLPDHLTYVAEFALASIVFHHDFLISNLSEGHRFLSSPIFRDLTLLNRLKPLVRSGLSSDSSTLRATGIPPHISILHKMTMLHDGMRQMNENLNSNRIHVVQDIIQELENRAIGAGTVTYDGLQRMIQTCLSEAGINEAVQAIREPRRVADVELRPAVAEPGRFKWGGRSNQVVPESFSFPDEGVEIMWQMWCIGNPINGYPAFKILKPDDLPSKNLRKRLSDLRYLMGRLRDKATEKGLNLDIQTIEQANNIFSAIEDAVALPEFSKSGRKRNRKEQLVWTTVVNLLRNAE